MVVTLVITGQRSFIPGLSAQFKGLFMHLSVVCFANW